MYNFTSRILLTRYPFFNLAVVFQFLCLGNDENAQRCMDLAYHANSKVSTHVDTLRSNEIKEIDTEDPNLTMNLKQQRQVSVEILESFLNRIIIIDYCYLLKSY